MSLKGTAAVPRSSVVGSPGDYLFLTVFKYTPGNTLLLIAQSVRRKNIPFLIVHRQASHTIHWDTF